MDLLMVDSTNAEVPGLDVIADGLEGDQTGNLPVSKRAEGAKSLVAASPKHTGMPPAVDEGIRARSVVICKSCRSLYMRRSTTRGLKLGSRDAGRPSVGDRCPRNPFPWSKRM